jgi:hypothetical protein
MEANPDVSSSTTPISTYSFLAIPVPLIQKNYMNMHELACDWRKVFDNINTKKF